MRTDSSSQQCTWGQLFGSIKREQKKIKLRNITKLMNRFGLICVISIAKNTNRADIEYGKIVLTNLGLTFVSLRRVPVPDARFDFLCEYFKPAR